MAFNTCLLSFFYGYSAYRSTQVKFPIESQHPLARSYVLKGTQEYEEKVKQLPGYRLKETMQPFFDKIGIRKDLFVTETINSGFCGAVGTNYFTKGDAVIFVNPGFENVDKDACYWVMKHEASHIKNNDCFNMKFVPAVCAVVAAIFIKSRIFTFVVGAVTSAGYSQYRETKADDLAIAEGSIEELKGGRRFLLAAMAFNVEKKKTFLENLMFSSTGENRADFLHPSLKSRVKKIDKALQQKDVDLDECKELEKIAKIKIYFNEMIPKMEQIAKKTSFFSYLF